MTAQTEPRGRTIVVRYLAVDGFAQTRRFATLTGARRYAQMRVGATPEMGGWYAVSPDGVGRVTVDGATLADLFPPAAAPARPRCPRIIPSGMYWDEAAGRLEFMPNEAGYIASQGDPMAIYEGDYNDDQPPYPTPEEAENARWTAGVNRIVDGWDAAPAAGPAADDDLDLDADDGPF